MLFFLFAVRVGHARNVSYFSGSWMNVYIIYVCVDTYRIYRRKCNEL